MWFGPWLGPWLGTWELEETGEVVYVDMTMETYALVYANMALTREREPEGSRLSTFGELKRQVMLRLDRPGGRTTLIVEQAINDTLRLICSIKDFDELMILDTSNAFTVAQQKSYHIVNDLALTRPKDIYTIRYMDTSNSEKLEYVPLRELDQRVPYTEMSGYGSPSYYTRRGMYIELYRIPDEVKPLYIQYSQWPEQLVYNSDECPFINMDPTIVTLATDMASSMMDGASTTSWAQKAMEMLNITTREDETRPDKTFIARGFEPGLARVGEYWKDPFYKGK